MMNKLLLAIPIFLLMACNSNETESADEVVSDVIADSAVTDSVITEDLPAFVVPQDLIFGFANMDGNQVLMKGEPEGVSPEEFTQIFDDKGKLAPITYKGFKDATENDNHRQTPYNFDNSGGHLYSLDKKIDEWQTIVFMGDDFLENRTVINTKYRTTTILAKTQMKTIEQERDWEIDKYEAVRTYENGVCTYFIQFKPKKDSILVALVFITEDNQIYYRDFPANYDEISTWRVDDGGEFYFDSYKVLGLFESAYGLEIITDWGGAEGSSSSYMILEGQYFVEKAGGYLYMAPT